MQMLAKQVNQIIINPSNLLMALDKQPNWYPVKNYHTKIKRFMLMYWSNQHLMLLRSYIQI